MKEILNLALVFFLSSYWLIVPIVFLVVMLFLLGTRKTNKGRWIIAVVALVGVVLMAWYGFGRVAYYDRQVRKLCAIDGGIKVYETVELPAKMFNRWGQPNYYHPTPGEKPLTTEYIIESERTYYRRGNPVVSRYVYKLIRRSDGKLLGESIRYGRGGGGLPGLWHPSSYRCPKNSGQVPLLVQVFKPIKEGKQ